MKSKNVISLKLRVAVSWVGVKEKDVIKDETFKYSVSVDTVGTFVHFIILYKPIGFRHI